jgi:hypothetical protein
MPARGGIPAIRGGVYPVIEPDPTVSVKGSEVRIARCVIHGISYDSEREVCPACAMGPSRVGD